MDLLKRLSLPVIMLLLAAGFWTSSNFKAIAAGVAIFLFGMLLLEQGFHGLSGGFLEKILKTTTNSTPKALTFGLVSTTIMQSSTLVSVLSISFLSAGMITLKAGLGIVFGSNLGTTTGAWLIATYGLSVSLSQIAMPMLVFGVILLFQRTVTRTSIGNILLGIGFLFLGIDYMKEGFAALQDGIDLNSLAPDGYYASAIVFMLFGFIATVIMQSSHATLVLSLAALASGMITYEAGAALAIGASIGTTITAVIGSLGSNAAGKRLALGHLFFNLIAGLVALAALPLLIALVDFISPYLGIGVDNYPIKVALFLTLFKLLGLALILPKMHVFQGFLERLVKEKASEEDLPQFLNQASLETPATAVSVTHSESMRLFSLSTDVIIQGLGWNVEQYHRGQPLALLTDMSRQMNVDLQQQYERRVKGTYSSIVDYISLAREKTSGDFDEKLREIRAADHHLIQAIKGVKHLQRNLKYYINGDNADMENAYHRLRLQIAEVLRTIENVRRIDDVMESRLSLDHQQLLIERERESSDSAIEELIRGRKITSHMAISLMTDKGYAYNVCQSLLSAARFLFIDAKNSQAGAVDNIELEVSDLSAINKQLDEQRSEPSVEESRS